MMLLVENGVNQESGLLGFRMTDKAACVEVEHELAELECHFDVIAFDEQVSVVLAERVAFNAVLLKEAPHLAWQDVVECHVLGCSKSTPSAKRFVGL